MSSQNIYVNTPSTSGLSLAGLIFSFLGWFTCGLLCIPGAFLSFLGLFSRGPKGAAIAGLIVGFPGVIFFAVFGMGFLLTALGIGTAGTMAAVEASRISAEQQSGTPDAAPVMAFDTQDMGDADPAMPTSEDTLIDLDTEALGSAELEAPAILDEPTLAPEEPAVLDEPKEPELREFTDSSGKFRVTATFVSADATNVKLRRLDGKEVTVPIARLSEGDQAWIAQQSQDVDSRSSDESL